MKKIDFIKNLILGFWKKGFIQLCETVLEHWIISTLIVVLIIYLCSNKETTIYAWFLIGIFAVYSALKAVIEIFLEIRNCIKSVGPEERILSVQKTGGKIFDLLLCVVGIFQALRVFSHISRLTKSASSAVNVVDDVAGAISKFLETLKR